MKTKTILLFLLIGTAHAAEKPLKITLEPHKEEDNRDYGAQLERKFDALLESNEELKAKFAAFEAGPKERAGGRYLGYEVRPLLLHQYQEAEFRDSGGMRHYEQTLVLYYVFGEGFHRGMEETSGVFAVFHITGDQSYDHKADDDFKLVKHTVSATFEGFRKTLDAEKKPDGAGE